MTRNFLNFLHMKLLIINIKVILIHYMKNNCSDIPNFHGQGRSLSASGLPGNKFYPIINAANANLPNVSTTAA